MKKLLIILFMISCGAIYSCGSSSEKQTDSVETADEDHYDMFEEDDAEKIDGENDASTEPVTEKDIAVDSASVSDADF